MADHIIVDTADLQQCINQYRGALSTLKDSYAAFTKSLEALRSDWTGKAFVIMAGKVAAMGVNIARSFNNLEDAVTELSEMIELTGETENSIKGVIANQEVGTQSPFNAG
ncbi:MAG: hypothetical protein E7327_05210 [Clostridiales bacterium]|nr:hypothetical protein [Clostridiales bacterium]